MTRVKKTRVEKKDALDRYVCYRVNTHSPRAFSTRVISARRSGSKRERFFLFSTIYAQNFSVLSIGEQLPRNFSMLSIGEQLPRNFSMLSIGEQLSRNFSML